MALFDFMNEGHSVGHLRQMLHHYRKLRDLLHRELHAHLGGLLEVHAPEAGMHLVGWPPPGKDDQHAAKLASQVSIEVGVISKCSLEPLSCGGLLFGYASPNEQAMLHGVQTLAAVLEQLCPAPEVGQHAHIAVGMVTLPRNHSIPLPQRWRSPQSCSKRGA